LLRLFPVNLTHMHKAFPSNLPHWCRLVGRTQTVNIVVADVLISTLPEIIKYLFVFVGQGQDCVVIRTRHHELTRISKTHDALCDVDCITHYARLPMHVRGQLHRTKIDSYTQLQWLAVFFFLELNEFSQLNRHTQGIFRLDQSS